MIIGHRGFVKLRIMSVHEFKLTVCKVIVNLFAKL